MSSTTKSSPDPDAAPLLIHPIGGGDLGQRPLATSPGPIDFHGSPGDRRPLHKVFDGLTETGTDIGGLLIIATTNTNNFSRRPFAEHAQHMKELLCSPNGLCGRTFARDKLHIVQVAEPTVRHGVDSLKPVLTALAPRECLLTSGAGSYALGAGVLLAGIETGVQMTLLPVDEPSAAYRLRDLIDPHDTLRNWLLRHRFWDELATVDPPNADLWQLLAARQRADISLAEAATPNPALTQGTLDKFRELWPTVQAAFYERLARGEAIDHALLRTWFTQRISKPSRKEDAAVPVSARRLLADLAKKLSDPEFRGGAGLIKEARYRLSPIPRAHHAALVGDDQFIGLFEESANHKAHLAPPGARRLPGSLLANADQWEKGDPVPGLVKQRDMAVWPVLGTGDVLVLMCVGMTPENDPADKGGHAAVHRVMNWASERCGTLARPGRVRLRLLASEETMERARSWVTLARATAPAGSLDAAVLGPFSTDPGDAAAINAALLTALGEAEPTGRYGSTSLRDVDEVLLVINSGKPVTVNGMVAAGVQWSLKAACPLRVAELGRDRALRTVLNEAGLALCRLGMDARLARLASSAVRRLDTRTAWQLLDTGSPALSSARDTAARLHRNLYGHAEPTTSVDTRREMACRRLELIAHVLADEPWRACYTAVEVLRPGLFDWDAWKSMRRQFAPLARLNAYRNETPYAHLLDRLREEQLGHGVRKPSRRPPDPGAVLKELRGAIDALSRPRSHQDYPSLPLVPHYTRLLPQLEHLGKEAR
ncbi:hypothetical protein [Actinomadura terrae]|uniref:hypothetical protein n=1 Tax=Actinomadura terrae TaxID=604353 RepID=UPI001FA80E1D|nr:hypothetical protein [Actinomadura terrae]